jgi:hypothetical protein
MIQFVAISALVETQRNITFLTTRISFNGFANCTATTLVSFHWPVRNLVETCIFTWLDTDYLRWFGFVSHVILHDMFIGLYIKI